MTMEQYIAFTQKRLDSENELFANLKHLHAQNLKLMEQINGSSTTETTAEGNTTSAEPDA